MAAILNFPKWSKSVVVGPKHVHAKFRVDWSSGLSSIEETKVWRKDGITKGRTKSRTDGGHFIVSLFQCGGQLYQGKKLFIKNINNNLYQIVHNLCKHWNRQCWKRINNKVFSFGIYGDSLIEAPSSEAPSSKLVSSQSPTNSIKTLDNPAIYIYIYHIPVTYIDLRYLALCHCHSFQSKLYIVRVSRE